MQSAVMIKKKNRRNGVVPAVLPVVSRMVENSVDYSSSPPDLGVALGSAEVPELSLVECRLDFLCSLGEPLVSLSVVADS